MSWLSSSLEISKGNYPKETETDQMYKITYTHLNTINGNNADIVVLDKVVTTIEEAGKDIVAAHDHAKALGYGPSRYTVALTEVA